MEMQLIHNYHVTKELGFFPSPGANAYFLTCGSIGNKTGPYTEGSHFPLVSQSNHLYQY